MYNCQHSMGCLGLTVCLSTFNLTLSIISSTCVCQAAWDHTVTPWLSHYCSVRRAESNNPGACMMPTSQVSKTERRALWTGRGVSSKL